MADSVHFANYENRFLYQFNKDAISGFNGFNFSTRLSEIDDVSGPISPSGFPIFTPLPWLHDIWWRIKSFKVSASVTVTEEEEEPETWSISNQIASLFEFRERSLASSTTRFFQGGELENLYSQISFSSIYGRSDYGLSGSSRFLRSGNNLMHNLVISIGRGSRFLGSWFPKLNSPTINTTIHGLNVPLYISNINSETMSASGSCSISVHEWWPYANSKGQPVWDKDTGEQINDIV